MRVLFTILLCLPCVLALPQQASDSSEEVFNLDPADSTVVNPIVLGYAMHKSYCLNVDGHRLFGYPEIEDGNWQIFFDDEHNKIAYRGKIINGIEVDTADYFIESGVLVRREIRDSIGSFMFISVHHRSGQVETESYFRGGYKTRDLEYLPDGSVHMKLYKYEQHNPMGDLYGLIRFDSLGFVQQIQVDENDLNYFRDIEPDEKLKVDPDGEIYFRPNQKDNR